MDESKQPTDAQFNLFRFRSCRCHLSAESEYIPSNYDVGVIAGQNTWYMHMKYVHMVFRRTVLAWLHNICLTKQRKWTTSLKKQIKWKNSPDARALYNICWATFLPHISLFKTKLFTDKKNSLCGSPPPLGLWSAELLCLYQAVLMLWKPCGVLSLTWYKPWRLE